jgi:hypothetical protein
VNFSSYQTQGTTLSRKQMHNRIPTPDCTRRFRTPGLIIEMKPLRSVAECCHPALRYPLQNRVVYRRRAVKKSELLRVGLQVLIDPVQPICNRIFAASLTRHGTFRRGPSSNGAENWVSASSLLDSPPGSTLAPCIWWKSQFFAQRCPFFLYTQSSRFWLGVCEPPTMPATWVFVVL